MFQLNMHRLQINLMSCVFDKNNEKYKINLNVTMVSNVL